MIVMLNGGAHEVVDGMTVSDLLRSLGLNGATVVVEINREIVSKETYPRVSLREGDRLEIAHFVGGGQEAARDGGSERNPAGR